MSEVETALFIMDTVLAFKMFNPVFGPMPEMDMSISKKSNSASVRNPYKSKASSRTARCVNREIFLLFFAADFVSVVE